MSPLLSKDEVYERYMNLQRKLSSENVDSGAVIDRVYAPKESAEEVLRVLSDKLERLTRTVPQSQRVGAQAALRVVQAELRRCQNE